MSIQLRCLAALVIGLVWGGASSGAIAADPTGTWLTQQGEAKIRVARCGKNMCGTIIWLRDPIDPATGKPHVDDKNPDPKLQKRKIIGLRIFNMAPESADTWAGQVYDSDDGKMYKAKITLKAPTQLEVQGCAGILCGSEMWSKQ
jgi:uncharacterized protein (DUF2147 family)